MQWQTPLPPFFTDSEEIMLKVYSVKKKTH